MNYVGMRSLLIRYEDLLVSTIGGLVLMAVVRIVIAQKRQRALMRASQAIAKQP